MTRERVAAFIAVAVLVAAVEAAAQEGTPPPLPVPGTLVDVGGWRLHLNCTGTPVGQGPTVILESGIGDFSVEWSLVQPHVAKYARVCSYDRAGDGWSDLGPHPRTFKQIVYELHTLLERAGERPPFVLVGQSYGGWLVRVYSLTYATEVKGIVLVDAGEDDPLRLLPGGKGRASELAKGEPIPPIKTSGPLRIADLSDRLKAAMTAGMADAVRTANDPPRDVLPADAKRMRTWALGQIGHVAAAVNPSEIEELALLHNELVKNPQPYGDMPLVVITRGLPESDNEAGEAAHRANHKMLANMSRRGRLLVAGKSGHHIHIQQPDVVVDAIRDVVQAARQ